MNKTDIYYFSGTGNSLHIAKELQKRVPGAKHIPMVCLLGDNSVMTDAETVGFVFPIHMTTIPRPVREFIKKLNLESAEYIFSIATRLGTTHSAFIEIEKILKKKGKVLNSHFTLTMPSNDPKFKYKVPTEAYIAEREVEVQKKLPMIAQAITKRENNKEKDVTATGKIPVFLLRLVPFVMALSEKLGFGYEMYADSKCTGCGICEKVCLSKKIKMENGRPVWKKDIECYLCSACINFCPKQAIQIRSFGTEKNGRYSHPYATVEDIIQEKSEEY